MRKRCAAARALPCALTSVSPGAPASHGAVLLHGTPPLSTSVLARAMSAVFTPPRRAGLLLIGLGVLGMASESVLDATARQLAGDGALLVASFSWSAYGLLARRIGLVPAHSASIVAVLSMCLYLPVFVVALPHAGLASAGWHELVSQAVFQGALIGAFSIFIYSEAVALLGTARTALLTAAVPGVTMGAAALLLHDAPSAMSLAGVVLVTSGMVLSMRSGRAGDGQPRPARRGTHEIVDMSDPGPRPPPISKVDCHAVHRRHFAR
jgi:drug/metabolite transporter (DMT)-like permease